MTGTKNMPNSENSVKSRGVLVFAINTDHTDYVKIADRTSTITHHTLGLPITLVTDQDSTPRFNYDSIIRIDNQGENWRLNSEVKISWKNFGRYLAYSLSPYHETLLLDTDYLVLDRNLLKLFHTQWDYRLQHHNRTTTGPSYEQMGLTSLPFVWATTVAFRKTEKSKLFFNLIGRIQRNYNYYRVLYNIREGNYRNDYAFAIANNIINGYNLNEGSGIPWPMFTIDDKIERMELTESQVRIYHQNSAVVTPYQNIHIMDKVYLQSDDFGWVTEAIIEST